MDYENSLLPLLNTAEVEQIADEARDIFNEVYNDTLKDKMHGLLQYGMPYVSDKDWLTSYFLSCAGLSVLKPTSDVPAVNRILKAWTVKNKKRSLDFLKLYLQVIYPNAWRVEQEYQDKGLSYPTALSVSEGENSWLTSRVQVTIFDDSESGELVYKYKPILKTIVPARFVVDLKFAMPVLASLNVKTGIGMAAKNYVNLSGTLTSEITMKLETKPTVGLTIKQYMKGN